MEWEFMLPVKLVFGNGKRKEIEKYIDILGGKNGVLVCGKSFTKNGVADEFVKMSGGKIKKIFSDVRANPTTDNVDSCVKIMREINADFAIALGGGSPMDCCKAACAIAKGDGKIRSYHSEGKAINKDEAIPMIAVTTTSGTASEVTNISVLTDVEKNLKNPMNDPAMYPKIAIIDPELTLTVPRHQRVLTFWHMQLKAIGQQFISLSVRLAQFTAQGLFLSGLKKHTTIHLI